jgi:hypothetical protein
VEEVEKMTRDEERERVCVRKRRKERGYKWFLYERDGVRLGGGARCDATCFVVWKEAAGKSRSSGGKSVGDGDRYEDGMG